MDKRFNRVVIRPRGGQLGNIHLGVWPFSVGSIVGIEHYSLETQLAKLPEPYAALARTLWDAVPGIKHLYFSNGQITIQHSGAFDDEEIIDVVSPIIHPVLEAALDPEEPSPNDGACCDEDLVEADAA